MDLSGLELGEIVTITLNTCNRLIGEFNGLIEEPKTVALKNVRFLYNETGAFGKLNLKSDIIFDDLSVDAKNILEIIVASKDINTCSSVVAVGEKPFRFSSEKFSLGCLVGKNSISLLYRGNIKKDLEESMHDFCKNMFKNSNFSFLLNQQEKNVDIGLPQYFVKFNREPKMVAPVYDEHHPNSIEQKDVPENSINQNTAVVNEEESKIIQINQTKPAANLEQLSRPLDEFPFLTVHKVNFGDDDGDEDDDIDSGSNESKLSDNLGFRLSPFLKYSNGQFVLNKENFNSLCEPIQRVDSGEGEPLYIQDITNLMINCQSMGKLVYSMMDGPFLKIGAKISIISRANVRYEGVFVEIDTENLQIALSDVHFYGTESRPAEVYIAEQERIYPYVIFKSTDIKDIRVMNNPDFEKPNLAPVQMMNGLARRDYPQSTLEFLRSFPLAHFDASQKRIPAAAAKHSLASQRKLNAPRSIWKRCSQSPCSRAGSGGRRLSPYIWRIPRVVDFVGRSGDPNELPMEANVENFIFDQEYDFEKNNKLFEDLLNGIKELNLSNASGNSEISEENDTESPQTEEQCEVKEQENEKENEKENKKDNIKENEKESENENEKEEKSFHDEIISSPEQGATPKKCEVYMPKSKLTPSAYDKAKSFFDTVSCASIYRSPNSNPNWREWNKETFGIPMIRHQRRNRRSIKNQTIKPIQNDQKNFMKNNEKIISEEGSTRAVQTEENVTVQKIRFQAVVVTKTLGFKSSSSSVDETTQPNFEKICKDDPNTFNTDDVEQYSLKSFN